ncbi:MAG: hypothetical protein ACI9ON_002720 [Limisphaerales bacterium]|jgi:hypothetical protein
MTSVGGTVVESHFNVVIPAAVLGLSAATLPTFDVMLLQVSIMESNSLVRLIAARVATKRTS